MIRILFNKNYKIISWMGKHEALLLTIMFSLFSIFIYGSLSLHQNIWYDEAYQLVLNRYSISEIIHFISKDFSPPLYALGLKLVTSIFGSSIFVGRMFSLSFVVGMFILSFYPIRRMFGKQTAIFFSSFLLFTNCCYFASIEIRTYSLAMFCTLGTVVYAIQLLKEEKRSYWILYTLFGIASLYSHNYAILCVFVLNIMIFIYTLIKKRNLIWKFFVCQTIMFLIFLPWVGILFNQAKELTTSFWINKPRLETFKSLLTFIFVLDKRINYGLISLLILGIIYAVFSDRRRLMNALFIFLPCFLSVGFFILWSYYKTPMFIPKYIVPTVGLIFFSISIIYGAYKSKWISISIIVLMFVGSFQIYKYEYLKTDDSTINNIKINFKEKQNLYFLHNNESTIGIMDYYVGNMNHIITDDIVWVVRTPELFGNVIKISDKKLIKDITDEVWLVNCSFKDIKKLEKEGFKKGDELEIVNPYFGTLFFLKMELN